MSEKFPGYDTLAKRNTLSWNEITRRVVDERLAMPREPHFFTSEEWAVLQAVCDRILPQPKDRPPVPLAAAVDQKLAAGKGDGYRDARLPSSAEAWRRGLKALDAEARDRYDRPFAELADPEKDGLLSAMQKGRLDHPAWDGMPPKIFFGERIIHDITSAYYSHPTAWNEIGFGGPAAPRGYVRMGADQRDAWEAVEAKPGEEETARRENRHVR